jgi:hypothetical protein
MNETELMRETYIYWPLVISRSRRLNICAVAMSHLAASQLYEVFKINKKILKKKKKKKKKRLLGRA